MAIQNNYVAVSYKLYVKDDDEEQEALVEQCDSVHPFQFISNLNCCLPAFEKQVVGLKKGEKFDFVIPCAEAYGEFQDELMFDVSKNVFELDGRFDKERIFEGNIIPLQGEDGERFNATVIEVKKDVVTIDLNHPRAGEDLHFVGMVVENREATNDELTGMINMMANDDCGCGCCCGDDHCGHGHCGHHHEDHDHCGHGHCGHHH